MRRWTSATVYLLPSILLHPSSSTCLTKVGSGVWWDEKELWLNFKSPSMEVALQNKGTRQGHKGSSSVVTAFDLAALSFFNIPTWVSTATAF